MNSPEASFARRIIVLAVIAAISIFALSVFVSESALAVEPPANDGIEDARIIRGNSALIRGNNEFATREKSEPDHIMSGSSVGHHTVWYRWTAWRSGPTTVDACRSEFDSILAVYTKSGEGKLQKVSDNDDGCLVKNPRGSSLVFQARLEKTYWISVSGYSAASTGKFALRLAPEDPALEAE